MKYTKQITFLLIINLLIVFLSIFTGNLTRKLEVSNNNLKLNIEKEKEQLKINKIEFSFYNNSDYLKKLHNIYFSFEEHQSEKKYFSFSNILDNKKQSLLLVNIK
tara:strand:- start:537 stop:851 length:315 start_codon:yes stop_codon:yes gene_type:complete